MIIYSVTISLEPTIEAQWIEWMKQRHIPDVLRTRCFTKCRVSKVVDADATGPVYLMEYSCPSLDEYHRYRDNFAPALQKEHADLFGGRFRGSRQILKEIAVIAAESA